jgi:hypothetical protein
MAINPIDLQAILLRMDNVSKLQQKQQDGIAVAQSQKAMELSELARIQSTRVNEVKPHPDGNTKVEEKKEGEKSSKEKKKTKGKVEPVEKTDAGTEDDDLKDLQDPFKGTIIDTKR